MSYPTICVTGATGNIGGGALNTLLKTLNYPPANIIVSTSHPSKLSELSSTGVQVRYGDFSVPASLRTAYAGADKLFLVSYPTMEHESRSNFHKAGIDAAIDVGIKHIYYTSLAFSGEPSLSPLMWAHSDTEKYLREKGEATGIKYTLIREALYHELFPLFIGLLNVQKAVADPENGRECVITESPDVLVASASTADLAEAAGRLIAHKGPEYDNRVVLLSGPKAYSIRDIARIVSSTLSLDPPLRFKQLAADEFVEYHLKNSQAALEIMTYPPGSDKRIFLQHIARTGKALANGETEQTTELLAEILGRQPRSLEQSVPMVFGMT